MFLYKLWYYLFVKGVLDMEKTNNKLLKVYKVMYRLTALNYRKQLSHMVENINLYNDKQVFELAHANNTGVDIKKIANPNLSDAQMRKIRLDAEFSTILKNSNQNFTTQGPSLRR